MGCGRRGLKSKTPVENMGKHQQCLRAAPQQWGCTVAPYLLPPFKVHAGFWHSPGGLPAPLPTHRVYLSYATCTGWGTGGAMVGAAGCLIVSHGVRLSVCLHNVFLSLSSMCRFHPRSSP